MTERLYSNPGLAFPSDPVIRKPVSHITADIDAREVSCAPCSHANGSVVVVWKDEAARSLRLGWAEDVSTLLSQDDSVDASTDRELVAVSSGNVAVTGMVTSIGDDLYLVWGHYEIDDSGGETRTYHADFEDPEPGSFDGAGTYLYRSTDEGESWSLVSYIDRLASAPGGNFGRWDMGKVVVSDTGRWIVSAAKRVSGSTAWCIWTSDDSGATWTERFSYSLGIAAGHLGIGQPSYAGGALRWQRDRGATGDQNTYYYQSVDDGENWTLYHSHSNTTHPNGLGVMWDDGSDQIGLLPNPGYGRFTSSTLAADNYDVTTDPGFSTWFPNSLSDLGSHLVWAAKHEIVGVSVDVCADMPRLHVPYKWWMLERGEQRRMELWRANWETGARWVRRVTGARKCQLKWRWRYDPQAAYQNWVNLERWANDCACKVTSRADLLLIPYKRPANASQEYANWVTWERWVDQRNQS